MSRTTDLKTRQSAAIPAGVGSKGIFVTKAENSELWDVDATRNPSPCPRHDAGAKASGHEFKAPGHGLKR